MGDELAPAGEGAHPAIGVSALGDLLKAPARHRLAEVMEQGIVVVRGRVPDVLSQHMAVHVETSTNPGHAPPRPDAKPDTRGSHQARSSCAVLQTAAM
jgi:hypothetical protein